MMNESVSRKVSAAIQAYENGTADYESTAAAIQTACGQNVSRNELETYWSSEDLESFVSKLVMPSIDDWESIDDARSLELLREIIDGADVVLLLRNCTALEKRYRKPQGTVLDLVNSKDEVSPEKILVVLKQDTVFYL